MSRLTAFLSAVLFTASMGAVQAASIGWELRDVVLDDGAILTGGFSFDVNASIYSNISISRSAGSVMEAQDFADLTPAASVTPRAGFVIFTSGDGNLTDQLFLQLIFADDLTEPGVETGFLTLGTGTGRCFNSDCSKVYDSGATFVTQGSVVPVPAVPLPASGLLLIAGAFGLGALRRRKA